MEFLLHLNFIAVMKYISCLTFLLKWMERTSQEIRICYGKLRIALDLGQLRNPSVLLHNMYYVLIASSRTTRTRTLRFSYTLKSMMLTIIMNRNFPSIKCLALIINCSHRAYTIVDNKCER